MPLSILAPGLLAAAVAAPVLRLEDHYFSLATLGITLLVTLVVMQWLSVTGGTNGLSGIPSFSVFGQTVASRYGAMLFVWGFVVAVGAPRAAHPARALRTRLSPDAREPPGRGGAGARHGALRFSAFVLSAGYGGLAGALMAHVMHVVSPEKVDLPLMVTCLTMTVIGGRLSVAGAILGALLIIYLREQFRFLENYAFIAYGVATLAFLILAPNGIVGALGGHPQPACCRRRLDPDRRADRRCSRSTAIRGPRRTASRGRRRLEDVRRPSGLDGVGLALRRGEIVGLIGPNGSGKTTLLNIISGLYDSDAGRLTFAGHDISRLAAFRIARLGHDADVPAYPPGR